MLKLIIHGLVIIPRNINHNNIRCTFKNLARIEEKLKY